MSKPRPSSGLLAAFVLLVAGPACTTTSSSSSTAGPTPATGQRDEMVEALNAQNPFSVLKRGMTAKQVEDRVGRPDEIAPFPNDTGAQSEIWVYIRSVPVAFREIVGGERIVPYVDPITGEMKEIREPIFRNETVHAEQRIELLMVEGLFVEWKQRAHSRKSIGS